jgi:aminocarboxymuconate-semialdehyde decarboxylase
MGLLVASCSSTHKARPNWLSALSGGYLPSCAPRSDHSCFVSPQNCDPSIVLKKKPAEYLNQLLFDALVFTPEALRHFNGIRP